MAAISLKRVLFVVPAFTGGAGGAERVTATLLRHLDRRGLECHLAIVQAGAELLGDLPDDVMVHHLSASRMRYAMPGLLRLVRRIRPQTILSTVAYANVPLLLAKPCFPRGTRLLVREATTPSAFLAGGTPSPRLWSFCYRRLYPRADAIVCPSDAIAQEFRHRFRVPAEKLVCIHNPVDQERVRQGARAGASPYTGQGPHVVAAGRLRREKGFDLLVEAMPIVLRQIPGAQVTILGEGPEEAPLKRQVRDLGLDSAVRFAGFRQNPWTWFAHADLFVLPSRFEGMPNSLLEALVLEVPVVATDCVATMRELRALDARIVLSEPGDPRALAQAMVSVLQRPQPSPSSEQDSADRLQRLSAASIASQYRTIL